MIVVVRGTSVFEILNTPRKGEALTGQITDLSSGTLIVCVDG
jgi:hypothetical protein